jgi:hypothetical protein
MADTPAEARRKARQAAGQIARASQAEALEELAPPPAIASKKGRGKKGAALPTTDAVDLESESEVLRRG